MNAATLALFVPACFALNMAPGPNNLLSLGNASRYGVAQACRAGVGRIIAFAIMLTLVALGLSTLLTASVWLFHMIKLAGAAYLFYLAWQLWHAQPGHAPTDGARGSFLTLARQEFLVAAGNPKAMLVFTAFLPQFVDPARPLGAQFTLLGGLFLAFEWVSIALYAGLGRQLTRWLGDSRAWRRFNRSCACLMASAGVGLLLSRRG